MSYKDRLQPHPPNLYIFSTYLSYILYPPLYIAGPIMSFNDFLWQVRPPPPPSKTTDSKTHTQHRRPITNLSTPALTYFLRFLANLLVMELILHFMYVVAIKDTRAWIGASPAQIAMVGFWNLIIVWLKVIPLPISTLKKTSFLPTLKQLLIPWRFFRLWALIDGIDPPENMVRCMANNYSALGFWRSWHRSYNLWIVRSVPIPTTTDAPNLTFFLSSLLDTSTSPSVAHPTSSSTPSSSSPSSPSGTTSLSAFSLGDGSFLSSSSPRSSRGFSSPLQR